MCIGDENLLGVVEHKFLFDDYGSIHLKLTGLTAELFEEMHDLNEEINFEFDDRGGMDYNGHFRAYR